MLNTFGSEIYNKWKGIGILFNTEMGRPIAVKFGTKWLQREINNICKRFSKRKFWFFFSIGFSQWILIGFSYSSFCLMTHIFASKFVKLQNVTPLDNIKSWFLNKVFKIEMKFTDFIWFTECYDFFTSLFNVFLIIWHTFFFLFF